MPFNRPHATFYQSANVIIAISFTIFKSSDFQNIVTLKSMLGVIKVTESGADQQIIHNFILVCRCNYNYNCNYLAPFLSYLMFKYRDLEI